MKTRRDSLILAVCSRIATALVVGSVAVLLTRDVSSALAIAIFSVPVGERLRIIGEMVSHVRR